MRKSNIIYRFKLSSNYCEVSERCSLHVHCNIPTPGKLYKYVSTTRLIQLKQPLQTTENLQLMNKALIFFTIATYHGSASRALQPRRGPVELSSRISMIS